MPKERFHIYLASRVVGECENRPPVLRDTPAFFIGALSPDIFYYDLPFFSLTSLGDSLHSLIEREGMATIYDWIAKKPLKQANAEAISWGLGMACHFMADALWHPLIDELSSAGLGLVYSGAQRLSPTERHRLIESEIEAFWLAQSRGAQKSDYLPADLWGKRDGLLRFASHYLSFLEFAGGHGRLAGLSESRISRCFLCQNFLLRLFANRTLGGGRDRLLSFPAARFLGTLVTPARPVLPDRLARAMPGHRNPFSNSFMKQAIDSLKTDFCRLAEKIAPQ